MSLEGLGTFTVEAPIPEVTDNERPVVIPANALSFHYDPKVAEDDNIVDFIVENTKKIKPLASADLNSFLTLGRQFLNIGKPFTIHNLGTLEKQKSGELLFKPGQVVLQKIEPPRDVTDNNLEENDAENLFNDYQQNSQGSGKQLFIVLLIILVVAAAGWAVWHYVFKKEPVPVADTIVPISQDTLPAAQTGLPDSTTFPGDTIANSSYGDSVAYNILIQESTNKALLTKRMERLKTYGRSVEVVTDDSVNFKLVTPMVSLPSDTLRILDSLNKLFYQGKASIQLR